ncbi:MAG: MarR family transcriptional regulator [Actinobacteria bacterium]|nr:MarR family transcriptional regulator [Actinomycetota bacterium]
MTNPGAPDAGLHLDNQLCFLVYRLHRGITDLYRPLLSDLGLTYPQYLVMLVLWEEEPMSVGRIGERLHLDSGTLSPLLKRLEAGGLITRTRDLTDERSVRVALTPAGDRLRDRARDVPLAVGGCLVETPDDYWALRQTLEHLVARVDEKAAH